MKKLLILLGALALTFTLSMAEGKCSGNKCDSSKKTEKKCDSGKCDGAKERKQEVPEKGKCGQGKCG
jgi:uncharacterized low-complexity protein